MLHSVSGILVKRRGRRAWLSLVGIWTFGCPPRDGNLGLRLRHRGVANEAPGGSPKQEQRTIPLSPQQTHQTAEDDIPSRSLPPSLSFSSSLFLFLFTRSVHVAAHRQYCSVPPPALHRTHCTAQLTQSSTGRVHIS